MMLRIRTLGPFRVHLDDAIVPETAWKTQKNKILLKILLTYRGHALAKEQLMEWLWPELEPGAAGRNLRVAVSQVRQALEARTPRQHSATYILTTDSGYAWNTEAGYWLDADEFVRLAADGTERPESVPSNGTIERLQSALGLYGGEYLEEDRYADWAVAERERLRELHFGLLTRLAEGYARQGRYGRAIGLCREVLVADGCRESVWCQLMLYQYHAGDQAQALRAYDECRRVLAEEMGVEPLPETTKLAAQIRRHAVTGRHFTPPPAAIERLRRLPLSLGRIPFAGREAEQARLLGHLEHVSAGQTRFVLVEGEAGAGKSRLVEETLAYARRQDCAVLEGCCWESEGRLPYQPIVEALRLAWESHARPFDSLAPTWLAVVAELLPEIRAAVAHLPPLPALPPEQEKAQLHEALAELLLAQAGSLSTLVLFLEDLHWADDATLEFLDAFARRHREQPVLVLATLRVEEVAEREGGALGRLLWQSKQRGMLERLPLGPLAPAAVVSLVEELAGSPDRGLALGTRLYRETEGNPLFLVATLQALFEEGKLVLGPDGWSTPDASDLTGAAWEIPGSVRQAILRRVQRLGDEERQVLEAAAVLGQDFDSATLYPMRAWRRDVLLDHLDRLERAFLIRERGQSRYAFSHDKIREATYQGIAPDRRGWLHAKAAHALEAIHTARLDEVAATLAHHFSRAGLPEKAYAYCLRAGHYAARLHANAEAGDHFRAALALIGEEGFQPAPEDLREAHERLGDLFQAAGQYGRAREHFEAAMPLATTPSSRVTLLHKLVHNHDRQGHARPHLELLREAVREVERLHAQEGHARGSSAGLVAAKIYARWAILGASADGAAESERYARQVVALLERHVPDVLHGHEALPWSEYDCVHSALINAGEAFRFWQRWAEAAALFAQSLAIAERQGDLIGIGYSRHNLGDVLLAQGEFVTARASYAASADAFARCGQLWEEMASHTHLGLAWACQGRWEEALAALECACVAGERMEPTAWLAEVYLWLSIAALGACGDAVRASASLERAARVAESAGQTLHPPVLGLAASLAEAHAGKRETAIQSYTESAGLLAADPGRAFYIRWLLEHCVPPVLDPVTRAML
ncbi:MAG TPA: AAA family ATPase [Ardenticatenaceae bacterium]|nr:AAA family ATPase [Ardenticatenaceae bacterium]